jgi:predicted histidine transporter YuiF (NhaC family)
MNACVHVYLRDWVNSCSILLRCNKKPIAIYIIYKKKKTCKEKKKKKKKKEKEKKKENTNAYSIRAWLFSK